MANINIKVSAIAAAAGFALSFLIALAGGVRLPMLILRPLLFAFVFFVFGSGIYALLKKFFSELFEASDNKEGAPIGGLVDISVGESEDAADSVEGADALPDIAPSVGDSTQALEQNSIFDYNEGSLVSENISSGSAAAFKPIDFEAFASPEVLNGGSSPERKSFARVPEAFTGDNADPKKMASTIKDLLKDD